MRPDQRQLDALCATLRSGLQGLGVMQAELEQAIETERRCGNTRPDGYGDYGHPVPADGPGVARAMNHVQRDPHREATIGAVRALEDACVAVNRLRTHLGKLDALRESNERVAA